VLAQIDKLEDVRESRVDWTGRLVLLHLKETADEGRAIREAAGALGEGTHRVGPDVETASIAAYRRGEPWLRANETLRLSREEARVIAEHEGSLAAKEAGLSSEKTRKLIALVQQEVNAAFERVEKSEGSVGGKLRKELKAAELRSLERSREFLSKEEIERVASSLPLD